MNAQVIYLPGWRQVDEEEMERRDDIQDALSMFHVNFEYEAKGLTEDQKKQLKEVTHFKLRQSMTVVKK